MDDRRLGCLLSRLNRDDVSIVQMTLKYCLDVDGSDTKNKSKNRSDLRHLSIGRAERKKFSSSRSPSSFGNTTPNDYKDMTCKYSLSTYLTPAIK